MSAPELTNVAENFRYEPNEGESLSMAVVSAVALAHNEGVLEQDWIINNDINPDALDGLFQDEHLNMTLRFEADTTTVTIDADEHGNPVIEIESHR
nr:HalOD1 output domain-containing protein [Natranaeroarchaeum aerophilus]